MSAPVAAPRRVLTRGAPDAAFRFAESAFADDSPELPTAQFHAWFAGRGRANAFDVRRVPFDQLDGWLFDGDTGDLVHHTGRFFAVRGLDVRTDHGPVPHWQQPIIEQPEVGVLGILVQERHGVLHCLMQAKMEPGNVNTLQLSPTVQATRSNYMRVHKGNAIPYLEHFAAPRPGRVLVDSLQTEQSAWFLHKRNRNMVVEVDPDVDVPVRDDFCWLTLGQLHRLLAVDNIVNMDSRTVLACVPYAPPAAGGDPFRQALLRSLSPAEGALHTMGAVTNWLTEIKARHELRQRWMPLRDVAGWHRTPDEIAHDEHRYFSVVGVRVEASNREITRWTQPLFAPVEQGLLAFVVKRIDGVLHVLLQARIAAGTFDIAELAPTVHCSPGNYRGLPAEAQPRYLDLVRSADPATIRYDALLSEEGGRFYHAVNRFVVVEPDDFPQAVPDGFVWVAVHQMAELLRFTSSLSVETRSLLACLHTLW